MSGDTMTRDEMLDRLLPPGRQMSHAEFREHLESCRKKSLEAFQAMSVEELTDWLLHTPITAGVDEFIADAAAAGDLPDEFTGRWLAANREAARRQLAEAEQFERFGRCRKAGISGVIRGGKP